MNWLSRLPKGRVVPSDVKKQVYDEEKPKARKAWRWYLTTIALAQLVFTDVVVGLLASGKWELDTTEFSVFVTSTFIEIVGIVVIAVKYDFSD